MAANSCLVRLPLQRSINLAPQLRDEYQRLAEDENHKHALDLDRLEFSVCRDEAPVIGALEWAMG